MTEKKWTWLPFFMQALPLLLTSHRAVQGATQLNCSVETLSALEEKVESLAKELGGEEAALDRVFSGRDKYDAATHQPLAFDGLTVIYPNASQDLERLNLGAVLQSLTSELKSHGLQDTLVFVNSQHFHITTFDLINIRNAKLLKSHGYDYEETVKQIGEKTISYLRLSQADRLQIDAHVKGLVTRGCRNLSIEFELNEGDQAKLVALRVGLDQYLLQEVAAYHLLRDEAWVRSFYPHITLAYSLRLPAPEQRQAFVEILTAADRLLKRGSVTLGFGQLHSFTSMDDYHPIKF